MNPATSRYPISVSTSAYLDGFFMSTFAHVPCLGLNDVFDQAAQHQTDVSPLVVWDSIETKSEPTIYSSAVAAKDASGEIIGVWVSEPMFRSILSALDHAKDLLGCELFPLISDGGFC